MATSPAPKTNPVSPTATWQRLTLSILGVALIMGDWRWAVYHLYTLPPAALSGFVSLTTNAFYVVGAIVIFMVTGRLVYEWKMETAQSVVNQAESTIQAMTSDTSSTDTQKSDPPLPTVPSASLDVPSAEEFISGLRSPKDFLSRDTTF